MRTKLSGATSTLQQSQYLFPLHPAVMDMDIECHFSKTITCQTFCELGFTLWKIRKLQFVRTSVDDTLYLWQRREISWTTGIGDSDIYFPSVPYEKLMHRDKMNMHRVIMCLFVFANTTIIHLSGVCYVLLLHPNFSFLHVPQAQSLENEGEERANKIKKGKLWWKGSV